MPVLSLNLQEKVIPVFQDLCLMFSQVRHITGDPLDILGCGEKALSVNSIFVGHTKSLEVLGNVEQPSAEQTQLTRAFAAAGCLQFLITAIPNADAEAPSAG